MGLEDTFPDISEEVSKDVKEVQSILEKVAQAVTNSMTEDQLQRFTVGFVVMRTGVEIKGGSRGVVGTGFSMYGEYTMTHDERILMSEAMDRSLAEECPCRMHDRRN